MKIFILPLLCISLSATAQKKDSALLQQFKFRTPNFRAVVLSGNAAGNFAKNSNGGSFYSLFLNPALQATRLVSTDKELSTYGYSAQTSFNTNNTSGGINQPAKSFNTRFTSSALIRKYTNQKFFTYGYTGVAQYNFSKTTSTYNYLENRLFSNATFTIGTGKGRIENVTDAQMAYNILADLQKNQLLKNDFTVEDATGLAKTITFINNTRLFDFRRKRIFELKQIDSFLNSKGLIKENSIDYFTTMTDNWFYAFNPLMRHGKEKYITLSPGIIVRNNKTTSNEPANNIFSIISKSTTATLTMGIEKAIAKNVRRQLTRGISLVTQFIYSAEKNSNNGIITNANGSGLTSFFNAFIQWGYYPTTRTSINTTVNNSTAFTYANADVVNFTNVSFNGNYFINYNTRLVVNVIANTFVRTDLTTSFFSSFNVGFQHFIR